MNEIINRGFYKHTYLDKGGRQKSAHLLVGCREFRRLRQVFQEKMRMEATSAQAIPGAIAHGAPPLPPLQNMQQQGHETAVIQHHLEPHQQTVDTDNTFLPPRGHVPMIQRGRLMKCTQGKRSQQVFLYEHAPPAILEFLNW
jgi:hypothetical protein